MDENTCELNKLKADIKELKEFEESLDQNMKLVRDHTEELLSYSEAYVTQEDLCYCFDNDLVLGIQAPKDTVLSVPINEKTGNVDLEINIKSSSGPINVMLFSGNNDLLETDLKTSIKNVPYKNGILASHETSKALRTSRKQSFPYLNGEATGPPFRDIDDFKNNFVEAANIILRGLTTSPFEEEKEIDSTLIDSMGQNHFRPLSPPPSHSDYLFSLTPDEGINDIFG